MKPNIKVTLGMIRRKDFLKHMYKLTAIPSNTETIFYVLVNVSAVRMIIELLNKSLELN